MAYYLFRLLSGIILFGPAGLSALFAASAPPTNAALTAEGTPAYGENTLLVATAEGADLVYQWFRGASGDTSRPVLETTAPRLFTPPLTNSDTYWVRVVNDVGSTDSPSLALTVPAAPVRLVKAVGNRLSGALGDGAFPDLEPSPILFSGSYKSVATASTNTLFVHADGALRGMGTNSSGELGLGDKAARTMPALITNGVEAVATATHTLILKTDGSVLAAGSNSVGQLGTGDTTERLSPVLVASGVKAVSVGEYFSLILKTDGTAWGAGSNPFGQLGLGDTVNRSSFTLLASEVAAIAAGTSHSLLLKTDGTLWGAGINSRGQLGVEGTGNRTIWVPISDGVATIAAGASHSLFVRSDGSLWATGYNATGQLGLGDTADRFAPAPVAASVAEIACGSTHSLFRKRDGTLWGMGSNSWGQLGQGSQTPSQYNLPVEVGGVHVNKIAAGPQRSFFLNEAKQLFGMGNNRTGVLRPERGATNALTPVLISYAVVQAVARSSANAHALLLADGTLLDTGGSLAAQTFNPVVIDSQVARIMLVARYYDTQPLEPALNVVGAAHFLHIKTDATLWGWGNNYYGPLQPGGAADYKQPIQVADHVAKAVASNYATLFLRQDMTLWKAGLLAPGSSGTSAITQLASDVVDVKSAPEHMVYLKRDGTLWGVGRNFYGELGGFDTGLYVSTPRQISSDVVSYSLGLKHTVFIKTNGELWGCGYSASIGGGSTGSLFRIATGVAQVQASAYNTWYLKTDALLWGVGYNLPNALWTFTNTPTAIRAGVASFHPSPDSENLFVFTTDGKLRRFGRNTYGQLALGHTQDQAGFTGPAPLEGILGVVPGGQHTLFLVDPATVSATAPTITGQPAGRSVAFGDFATLQVTASGTESLLYQWYRGASGDTSAPVPYANYPTLVLPAFVAGGPFWCRVTNVAGSVDSTAATISFTGGGSPDFRTWAEAAGLRGSGLCITTDTDGDGLVNLLEYALGSVPTQSEGGPGWGSEIVESAGERMLVLTHRRRKGAAGLFAYERSPDLISAWQPLVAEPAIVNTDPDGTGATEEVAVSVPLPPDSGGVFLRFKVLGE